MHLSTGCAGPRVSQITRTQTTSAWFDHPGPWEWNIALSEATSRLGYQPVVEDFFGYTTNLSEPRVSRLVVFGYAVLPHLTLLGGTAAHGDFARYQSIWFNEFYQQSFAGLPGLEDPTPPSNLPLRSSELESRQRHGFWCGARARLFPTCREMVHHSSRALDEDLSWSQRPGMALHLLFCRLCRHYRRQIHWLRRTMENARAKDNSQGLMPAAMRERLKQALRRPPPLDILRQTLPGS